MRIETIVGPAIFGIAIAVVPGASLAVQVVGISLAVAPALALAVRAGRARLRRAAERREGVERARVPPAAERTER
jgi:uncharacterized lipoprotein YbaY